MEDWKWDDVPEREKERVLSDWKWSDISEREKWVVYWGVMWRGLVTMIGFLLILTILAAVLTNTLA